jgi:hypothetical protein
MRPLAHRPARTSCNRRMVRKLQAVGTPHDMNSVLRGIVWASLRSPRYTLEEQAGLWHGKLSSGVSALWDEMLATA